MMDSQVAAFAVVAFILTLTPGADTMLVIRNSLLGGVRKGLITAGGVCCGLFFHASLSALGLSLILLHSAAALALVKWVGACYLSWLGLKAMHRSFNPMLSHMNRQPNKISLKTKTYPMNCFFEGFLCNTLNPKVALFYLAMLPQFLAPKDPLLVKSFLLASIHFSEAFVWLTLVVVMVERIRMLFAKHSFLSWLEAICGTVLVGFGIRLAWQKL